MFSVGNGEGGLSFWEDTYISPSLPQLATIVPSWMKSTPPTGSECAGRLLMTRAPRTSQRKTASS